MTLKTAASLIAGTSGSGLGQMAGKNSLVWGGDGGVQVILSLLGLLGYPYPVHWLNYRGVIKVYKQIQRFLLSHPLWAASND